MTLLLTNNLDLSIYNNDLGCDNKENEYCKYLKDVKKEGIILSL